MVYALKSYNNNQTYRRREERSVIDTFIRRFNGEDVALYQQYSNTKKSFLDKSVQKLAVNSIIEGNFPQENVVRQMAIKRVNKTLGIILGLLITVVIASYYCVISCEMKLNDLSRQTTVLNNENAELQIKLDTLKSFNNVDKTLQQNNMLQKAGQVVETPEIIIDLQENTSKHQHKKIFSYALGF